ncbi:MAG: hypothetical protein BGP12_11825 [Rhodospirillales bacterium 70-18]|nr:hypothetical protein [Rhodospirillales bacterium]OJY68478.1 MAG: hypothetical protein BGP12_11825 [Rhodospirillales bacterium 70-18]
MFSVEQKVWHRNGQRSGTVLECDGDLVFIAQENGVEVEFQASDLTATPPADASASGGRLTDSKAANRPVSHVMPGRTLTPRDITEEHLRLLGNVPVRTLQEVAALFEHRPGAGKFSALDAAGKLNLIAEITAVPYRTMRTYIGRPGELGLLMGKSLADARKAV